MSKTANQIFIPLIKTLISSAFKLVVLTFAYLCKFIGVLLQNVGEFLAKISTR